MSTFVVVSSKNTNIHKPFAFGAGVVVSFLTLAISRFFGLDKFHIQQFII